MYVYSLNLGLLGIYALYVCVLAMEYFEDRSKSKRTGIDHNVETNTNSRERSEEGAADENQHSLLKGKSSDINDDRTHKLLRMLSGLISSDEEFGGKIVLCITVKLNLLVLSAT